MGFLSSLTSLFSSDSSNVAKQMAVEESIEYNDFSITPSPISEGGQYRLSATITKMVEGELKSHLFIRSDVVASREDCIAMTIRKTKMAIDQMGEDIFN
jgi:hypothetical protein